MKKYKILALITAFLLIASSVWAGGGPTIYGVSGPMDGVETLTDGGILVGSGSDAITALGVAANGQIPIGDGATDPVLATITGTANQITITNAAGSITLSTPQDIATSSTPTFAGITHTSAGTASYDSITLTPTGNLASSAVWRGIYVNGAGLDPSAGDAEIYSLNVDFSGVLLTNEPILNAIDIVMPVTYSGQSAMAAFKATGNGTTIEILDNDQTQSAIHVDNGRIHVDLTAIAGAGRHLESFETVLTVDNLDANSIIHAFEVSATGSTSGEVTAIGTHPGVGPVHQHVGTFGDMDWGGTFTSSTFADKTTEFNTSGAPTATLTAALDDYFLIADVATFGNIQINLLVASNKDQFLEFFYGDGSQLWVEFFPEDTTDGLQNDGNIMWDIAGLAAWGTDTVNEITGLTGATPFYWIKIVRTRVGGVSTDPTETQLQILSPTQYGWDENGDLSIKSVTVSNGSTSAGYIYFVEDTSNGTNTVQLIGPASTADVVVTLPATTGTVALTGAAIDAGANTIVTTGKISGAVNVFTSAGNVTPSTPQIYGGVLIMTAAGQVTLPDVCDSATGANILIRARDVSEQVEVGLTDSNDLFVLTDGTELTANDELDLATPAGSQVGLVCWETGKWYVVSEKGTATDGGTP